MAEDTVYQGLVQRLRAVAAVTALVGDRIRPMKLKQNETMPAVVINRLSTQRFPGYGSEAGHAVVRVQVDVFGSTERETLDAAEEVRLALRNWSGAVGTKAIRGTFLANERDWWEDVSGQFRVLQEWTIHHSE